MELEVRVMLVFSEEVVTGRGIGEASGVLFILYFLNYLLMS